MLKQELKPMLCRSYRRAGKVLEREPQKCLGTAGKGKRIALLVHGYKKVYVLYPEG